MKTHILKSALIIVFPLTMASCLKTRAQLQGDPTANLDAGEETQVRAPSQQSSSTGNYALDEIKAEITRLNGRILDLERGTTSTQSNRVDELEIKVTQLEKTVALLSGQLSNQDPEALFNNGVAQYKDNEFETAAEMLTQYLRKPGKHEIEARFYRGESYFSLNRYKSAILDYREITEKHSKSPYAPKSLFKIAQGFSALGLENDAKLFYNELIETFPKSQEAKNAKKKLAMKRATSNLKKAPKKSTQKKKKSN